MQRVSDEVIAGSIEFEEALADLVIMVSPFAPMFASELWTGLQSCSHKSQKYNWVGSATSTEVDYSQKPCPWKTQVIFREECRDFTRL